MGRELYTTSMGCREGKGAVLPVGRGRRKVAVVECHVSALVDLANVDPELFTGPPDPAPNGMAPGETCDRPAQRVGILQRQQPGLPPVTSFENQHGRRGGPPVGTNCHSRHAGTSSLKKKLDSRTARSYPARPKVRSMISPD